MIHDLSRRLDKWCSSIPRARCLVSGSPQPDAKINKVILGQTLRVCPEIKFMIHDLSRRLDEWCSSIPRAMYLAPD